jgi:hypothetical protein
MGQEVGFVTAALQLGYESLIIKPRRGIGTMLAQVTIEENHNDNVEITDHPIDSGATISDHAFLRPSELVIKAGWSNSASDASSFGGFKGLLNTLQLATTGINLPSGVSSSSLVGSSASQIKQTYEKLLKLQSDRELLEVYTGKRRYENMLIKSLQTHTDAKTENSLIVTITMRQIIRVKTKVLAVMANPEDQKYPETSAVRSAEGTKQLAPAPNYNAGAGRGSINPALVGQ